MNCPENAPHIGPAAPSPDWSYMECVTCGYRWYLEDYLEDEDESA